MHVHVISLEFDRAKKGGKPLFFAIFPSGLRTLIAIDLFGEVNQEGNFKES